MKTILFFLSVACTTSYAVPTPLCNQNGDVLSFLPVNVGVFHTVDTGNTLSVPVLAEPSCAVESREVGEARESTGLTDGVKRLSDSRGAQNSLASGVESRHAPSGEGEILRVQARTTAKATENAAEIGSGSSAPPSQNLQQERGDVKCEEYHGKMLSETGTTYLRSSSAAPTFKSEGAACPQAVLAATSLSIPKLSAGEAYASLIDTATTSIEPPILEGNSLEERALW